MTPGRASLLFVVSRVPRCIVASRAGVGVASVKSWCAGRSIPGRRAREALWLAYEIPCDSWSLRRCVGTQLQKVRHG